MTEHETPPSSSGRPGWLTNRVIIGIVVAVLLLVFITVNRDKTTISFILFSAETSLWVALAISGAAGCLVGFLLGRRRYRT